MRLRIKEICKEKGMQMDLLAKAVDVHRVSMSLISSGKMNTTLDTLQKIADALGVPITELFEDETKNSFLCPHCGKKITIAKED